MEIADYIIADDRALVELVLQGDNIAFEYLFERYKEAIHRLFIQRTNNPLDADDLLRNILYSGVWLKYNCKQAKETPKK